MITALTAARNISLHRYVSISCSSIEPIVCRSQSAPEYSVTKSMARISFKNIIETIRSSIEEFHRDYRSKTIIPIFPFYFKVISIYFNKDIFKVQKQIRSKNIRVTQKKKKD